MANQFKHENASNKLLLIINLCTKRARHIMHRRLLNITSRPLRRYMHSSAHNAISVAHKPLTLVPRRLYAENPKLDPRFAQSERSPLERKAIEAEEELKSVSPQISVPETQVAADDEREQIRRQRQQIKKREVSEDMLGITTVKKKKSILDHVKEGIASIKKSLKDLYKDGKYVWALKKQKGSWKNLHLFEYVKYKNINYDLVKFLPYSLFLTVPFAEFALPIYIMLLPNSTPTQFYSEKTIGERTQKMIIKQKEGHDLIKTKLYTVFGNDFLLIKQKCKVLRENPGDKDALDKLVALDARLQQKLKDEWDTNYSKKLGYYNLTVEEREALLKVFYIEYISGVYMINQLYNLPFVVYNFVSKYAKTPKANIKDERWKLNIFPVKQLKTIAFRIQLLRHLQRVRKEDKLLFRNEQDELDRCSSIELFELIRKRGFKIESETDSKAYLARYWKEHEQIANPDIRVWSIMLRHYYADYLV